MPLKTTPFRASDYMETAADVSHYIATLVEDGDVDDLIPALRQISDSKGMRAWLAVVTAKDDDISPEQWSDIEKATEAYQDLEGEIISGEPWPTRNGKL